MKLSAEGQKLIERWEGRRNTAYKDSAGKWTIGVGHLIGPNEGHLLIGPITDEQVNALFRADVAWAEQAVERLFPRLVHQTQFDALVSFVYNLGETAVRNGSLDDLINNGASPDDISAKWLQYSRAGGQVVQGLLNRRKAELAHYWSYLWRTACLFLLFAAGLLLIAGQTIRTA